MPDPDKLSAPSATPEQTDEQTPESADTAQKPEVLHEETEANRRDLAEFSKSVFEKQQNRENEITRFKALDKPGTDSIEALRRGDTTEKENENDTLEKHARLTAAFLEKTETEDKKMAYTVNFGENKTAEKYVGAGDMLPANVEAIMVTDDKGNILSARAVRNVNTRNRIGYYDAATGEYVPIHSGFRITILATRTDSSRKLTQENENGFRADPLLARRKLGEHITLFRGPQNRESEDLQVSVGPSPAPPASATAEEIKQNELPQPKPENKPATKEITEVSDLTGRGYSRKGFKVTPAVAREAARCLKKGGPIGTTHFFEIDGKKYAMRREMHRHPPGDCPPLPAGLCGPHHGISVFAA